MDYKKSLLLFCVLLVLLLSFSIISAADNTTTKAKTLTKNDKTFTQTNVISTKVMKKEIVKNNDNKITKKKDAKKDIINVKTTKQLQNAINQKDSNTKSKTINLAKRTYKITSPIELESQKFNSLIINGNGAVITGENRKQFLNISEKYIVTLNRLTIKNFRSSDKGGAIENYGTLKINKCNFNNNKAHDAGAIYSGEYTKLVVSNSNFKNNRAHSSEGHGGSLFADENCVLTVKNSNFDSNIAGGGGAIYTYGKSNIVGKFTNNKALQGGAIHSRFLSDTVIKGRFIKNVGGIGGVICDEGNKLKVDGVFKNNRATYWAGAIITFSENARINGVFINNSAKELAGAISVYNDNVKITGTFIGNYAKGDYGLVANKGYESKIVTSPSNNKKSTYGGSIYNEGYNLNVNIKSSNKKITSTKLSVTNTKTACGKIVKKTVTVKTKDNHKVTGGLVEAYVNGKFAGKAAVKEGKATVRISRKNSGKYRLKYKYTNPVLKTSQKTTVLTVNKLKTSISLSSATVTKGQSVTKTIYVKSNGKNVNEGTVKVYINGNYYRILKVKNGKATFKTPSNKAIGRYTMTAVFSSNNYLSSRNYATLTVKDGRWGNYIFGEKVLSRFIRPSNTDVEWLDTYSATYYHVFTTGKLYKQYNDHGVYAYKKMN